MTLVYFPSSLSKDMLPPFISSKLAEDVLVCGKSIAFLREACRDSEWTEEVQRCLKVVGEPLDPFETPV